MAKFCQHCADLPGELKGTPEGSIQDVGGVPSYVTKGSADRGTIVYATDIYGLGITNPKLVADKLSKQSQFTVVVPDIFEGDPMKTGDFVFPKNSKAEKPTDEQMGQNMSNMMAWVQKGHSPNESYPLIKKVIQSVSERGPVGIVGHCYGGKLCSLAAQEKIVQGAAIFHAAMLEADEANQIRDVPILLNMAEWDPTFNGVEGVWQDTLKSNGLLDKRSQKYSGTCHGFGGRPDQEDPQVMKAFEEANSNTAAFFRDVLI